MRHGSLGEREFSQTLTSINSISRDRTWFRWSSHRQVARSVFLSSCSIQNKQQRKQEYINDINFAGNGFNGEMHQYFDPAADIPSIVLAVLVVIINGLVLLLLAKKKHLRSITNLLLCSLASSDLLTGVVAVPMFITCNVIRQSAVCLAEEEMSRFISASIVCHLMAVTTDRWVIGHKRRIIFFLRGERRGRGKPNLENGKLLLDFFPRGSSSTIFFRSFWCTELFSKIAQTPPPSPIIPVSNTNLFGNVFWRVIYMSIYRNRSAIIISEYNSWAYDLLKIISMGL